MKNNVLISTGGSGGHVIPATILYEHLIKETNVIISTDFRGLRYLDKEKHEFQIINTPKLKNIFFLPFSLILIFLLIFKSFLILKKKNIETVISTGGYMSLPVILAAKLLKLNIYLLEPNQILGRANRYFLKSCKKIFCYSEKIKNFPETFKDKIVEISPLVREEIYKLSLSRTKNDKFNILVIGGSQGAYIFDKSLKYQIANVSKDHSIKIIQQTKEKNILDLKNFYSQKKVENLIFSYEKNFSNILRDIDLCITRGGASTLAELSILNIPFIVVPLPSAKDNHQFENANFYQTNESCWIVTQNLFEKKIEGVLKEILKNKEEYLKKKENLKKLNYQNTWINVNQKILSYINEN